MEYSMSLEKIATDIYALVTGSTSQSFEQPISVQFLHRQCGYISCQPTIESAARCYEGALKGFRCGGRFPATSTGLAVTAKPAIEVWSRVLVLVTNK